MWVRVFPKLHEDLTKYLDKRCEKAGDYNLDSENIVMPKNPFLWARLKDIIKPTSEIDV